MSKRRQKRSDAYFEIVELKGKRRADIIKMAACLAIIIVVVTGRYALSATGLIDPTSMIPMAIVMFATIALAIWCGTSSMNFTKSGQRIRYLKQQMGISDDDIKAFEQSGGTQVN